jgi:hypothetical protein
VDSFEKCFHANHGSEKYTKRLIGIRSTQPADALQRLDMLTREETGMAVARNLEVTHEVDGTLKTVDNNVNEIVQGAQRKLLLPSSRCRRTVLC